ncbi:MAG: YybH family protein [Gemmatimonadota bacterium]
MVGGLAILGCRTEDPAAEDTVAVENETPGAAVADIQRQSSRFSAAYEQGDMETLLSIYADDGVAAPGGRDFIRGRPSLDSLWMLPEGSTILRHDISPISIRVDGDHAYDWGYYEGQAARNGEPLEPFRGKYLIVWERGDDGAWRMVVDMWNRAPEPDEP